MAVKIIAKPWRIVQQAMASYDTGGYHNDYMITHEYYMGICLIPSIE